MQISNAEYNSVWLHDSVYYVTVTLSITWLSNTLVTSHSSTERYKSLYHINSDVNIVLTNTPFGRHEEKREIYMLFF